MTKINSTITKKSNPQSKPIKVELVTAPPKPNRRRGRRSRRRAPRARTYAEREKALDRPIAAKINKILHDQAASAVDHQAMLQDFEAKASVDSTVDVRMQLQVTRVMLLVDVFIQECLKSTSLNNNNDLGKDYAIIMATMLDDAARAVDDEISNFRSLPRLWFQIRESLRPCRVGNYSFKAQTSVENVNMSLPGTSVPLSGYPSNFYWMNTSGTRLNQSTPFTNDGGVAPTMNSFVFGDYVVNYDYTSKFFLSYGALLDIVEYSDTNSYYGDPSIFAYRRSLAPPQGNNDHFGFFTAAFTYQDYIPGLHPHSSDNANVTMCLLENKGPYLEVPIRTRWLACLGLFTEPPVTSVTVDLTARYPAHSVSINCAAPPKLEMFHRLYVKRELNSLAMTANVQDPSKMKAHKAAVRDAKNRLRAVPQYNYFVADEWVTCAFNAASTAMDTAGEAAIDITSTQAATIYWLELFRHFQQWSTGTQPFGYKFSSLQSTSALAITYGGGVGRFIRTGERYSIPIAIATNLSMIYPTLVVDGSSSNVSKILYPALVFAGQSPYNYVNIMPSVFPQQTPPNSAPWGNNGAGFSGVNAWANWGPKPTAVAQYFNQVNALIPMTTNKLIRHPVCLTGTLNMRVNSNLNAEFGNLLALATRSKRDDPSADTIVDNRLYFHPVIDKILLDAAATFLLPTFYINAPEIFTLVGALGLPLQKESFGDLNYIANKVENLSIVKLLAGGLYSYVDDFITTFNDEAHKLGKSSLDLLVSHGITYGVELAGAYLKLKLDHD